MPVQRPPRDSMFRHDVAVVGLGYVGLPTALAIAQAHGGTIEVDSAVGRGSTFHLVIPRHDA